MLEGLLNSLGAGLLIIDREHRVEWMNKKAAEWLGPFVEVGKRRRCYRTFLYTDSFCTVCPTGKAIDYGTLTHYEFKLPQGSPCKTSQDYRSTSFEVVGIPVFDSVGHVSKVIELVLDVTKERIDKIRIEELMAQIEKMAALGQLAAGVAHELNTPLATISIISQELDNILEGGSISRDEIREYLADMDGEIKRCKAIIEDLLQFSSKRGIPELIDTDINSLVSKTVELVRKGGIPDSCHISCDLDPGLAMVKTDPERFRQVVFNTLKNAIEAVEDRIDGRVSISTGVDNGFTIVNITDNGHGIRKDDIKRVFEPFFTTKPVGKGTGLGLSVSYGIIKDLGGDIKIESNVGEGTVVSLSLPLS